MILEAVWRSLGEGDPACRKTTEKTGGEEDKSGGRRQRKSVLLEKPLRLGDSCGVPQRL